MRFALLALVAILALPAAALDAAAARTVVRTYESPAPVNYASSTYLPEAMVLSDGWLDVGGVIGLMPAPGETTVAVEARDASGLPVMAVFCQDGDPGAMNGCDVNNPADVVVQMCDGNLPTTAIRPAYAVNVFIVMPGNGLSSCMGQRQAPTVTGTITFVFG